MTLQIEIEKTTQRKKPARKFMCPDEYFYRILKVCASSYNSMVALVTLQNRLEAPYTFVWNLIVKMEQRGLIRLATMEERIALAKHRIVTVRGDIDKMARKYAEIHLKRLITLTDKGVWMLDKLDELYTLLQLPSRLTTTD